jgi:hypothetical protein
MSPSVSRIKVGQSLHGYQDGHSLLATSEDLPHGTESILFDLSDLSGPQLVSGFDEYLTGYPLPEISSYAFAKTWYAPEMQRPGCVWTHTLLIRSSDIAQIQSFHDLIRYFKRPTLHSDSWAEYNEQVEVPTPALTWEEGIGPVPFLLDLYSALYSGPDVPVLLPADNSRQFESLVLRIWSQQWPRLRRVFKFCTGAIEGRVSEGKSFDLQVIPHNSIGRIQHEIDDAIIIQAGASAGQRNIPRWIAQIADDFISKNTRFRDFLRDFGADVAPRRTSFRKLVEAYNLKCSDLSFLEYWDTLLTLFPSQNEATKLKTSAVTSNYGSKAINAPVAEKLSALAASHHDSGYPKRMLELIDLNDRLMETESLRDTLQALSAASYINSFGENLIQEIAIHIEPEQLAAIASTPSALMLLLARNPRLARFPELWTVTTGRHQQLLDLIAGSHLAQPDWEEIMHAAIQARVPQVGHSFVRIMGVAAVHAALNICQQYFVELPRDWNSVFGEHTGTVAEWLRSHADVKTSLMKALAQALSPFDSALLALGSDIWQPLLETEMTLTQRAYAFMLLLGLQNPSGKPYELIAQTFGIIHKAAELERLESDTWIILRDSLPVLGWGRDWDVCERLRRLLIGKYVSYGWPIQSLFRALQDREAFERTLLYIVSEKHLRPFGRFLLAEARSGSASPSDMQSEALMKCEKKLRK